MQQTGLCFRNNRFIKWEELPLLRTDELSSDADRVRPDLAAWDMGAAPTVVLLNPHPAHGRQDSVTGGNSVSCCKR